LTALRCREPGIGAVNGKFRPRAVHASRSDPDAAVTSNADLFT
jgi:hypothetical protein